MPSGACPSQPTFLQGSLSSGCLTSQWVHNKATKCLALCGLLGSKPCAHNMCEHIRHIMYSQECPFEELYSGHHTLKGCVRAFCKISWHVCYLLVCFSDWVQRGENSSFICFCLCVFCLCVFVETGLLCV